MGHESLAHQPDPAILTVLGERLRSLRGSMGLTLEEVAERAGVASRTVSRAEHGQNPTLLTVVRLLRVYNRLGALEQLIPEPDVSPMALIRRRQGG
jgi:transcriptional regulator with XRE-family HTH domain